MKRTSYLLVLTAVLAVFIFAIGCSTNPAGPQDQLLHERGAGALDAAPPVVTGAIAVISPNGGEQWFIGSAQTISWTLPVTDNITPDWTITLILSRDGGKSYNEAIAKNLKGLPTKYQWKVDGPKTLTARVMVILQNPAQESLVYTDTSDKDFFIVSQ